MGGRRGILALAGCSVAIFWPGAMIFGFPGVMGPYWQELLGVGQGAIGNTMFFVLASVGFFMFLVGRWQEKVGTRLRVFSVLSGFIISHVKAPQKMQDKDSSGLAKNA